MQFHDACFDDSEDDMIRSLLNSDSDYIRGITLERLEHERSVALNGVGDAGRPYLPFAEGGFTTASGKFEFGAEDLSYSPPTESRHGDASLRARFPLEIISGKNDDSMNSTFGFRDDVHSQTDRLSIHADDAAQRGITTGCRVKVFNARGECYFKAEINDDVQPGLLRARSLGWRRRAPHNLGINHLTSERLTDIGGGPTFYSCLVDVELA
jgi:anaerobic selenocysteine-containing dehydrogenase